MRERRPGGTHLRGGKPYDAIVYAQRARLHHSCDLPINGRPQLLSCALEPKHPGDCDRRFAFSDSTVLLKGVSQGGPYLDRWNHLGTLHRDGSLRSIADRAVRSLLRRHPKPILLDNIRAPLAKEVEGLERSCRNSRAGSFLSEERCNATSYLVAMDRAFERDDPVDNFRHSSNWNLVRFHPRRNLKRGHLVGWLIRCFLLRRRRERGRLRERAWFKPRCQ